MMRRIRATLLVLSAAVSAAASAAAAPRIEHRTASSHPMQYLVSRPDRWRPGVRWPVLVVIESADRQFDSTMRVYVRERGARPWIIVMPFVLTAGGSAASHKSEFPYPDSAWASAARDGDCRFDDAGLTAVLADVERLDGGESRVFMGGLEAAGHVIWSEALHHPERLNAAAMVTPNYIGRCVDGTIVSTNEARIALPVINLRGTPPHILHDQWQRARALAEQHGYRGVQELAVAGPDGGLRAREVLATFDSVLRVSQSPEPRRLSVRVNGVRLQYLDYGGTGPGMVFLPGLDDSPHAYDEIAPHFTSHFHVVSYARRAHGGSDAIGPYDMQTLADDLRELLDSLRMPRAVLAGWSMGGAEITALAERHPERLAAAVFLDTADLSGPTWRANLAAFPVSYQPDPRDRASEAAFRRWWKESNAPDVPWTRAMNAELDNLYQVAPDGSVRVYVNDSLEAIFIQSMVDYVPRYDRIHAPVLAFWAEWYAEAMLPPSASDGMKAKVGQWCGSFPRRVS